MVVRSGWGLGSVGKRVGGPAIHPNLKPEICPREGNLFKRNGLHTHQPRCWLKELGGGGGWGLGSVGKRVGGPVLDGDRLIPALCQYDPPPITRGSGKTGRFGVSLLW